MISYDRVPSDELQALLMPKGPLAWLVDLNTREIGGREFDVHFRGSDEVHVYHGGTSLIKVKRLKRPKAYVSLTANKEYKRQPCAEGLFRWWRIDDPKLCEAAEVYLRDVKVGPRRTGGEGVIQMRWSRVRKPWVAFDREAVLGNRFARRMEIDQLAVDPDGRLVLIEIKDASASNADQAPCQLGEYVQEWHRALAANPVLIRQVQALLDARMKVGLTPQGVPDLTGSLRGVVCFGAGTRSDEVKRRYDKILRIVNDRLPPGVGSIETWKCPEGTAVPQRVA